MFFPDPKCPDTTQTRHRSVCQNPVRMAGFVMNLESFALVVALPGFSGRTLPNPMTMRRLSQDYPLVTFLNVVPKFIVNIPN